ncbi:hypothetical protein DIPPA_26416 [Diplonema papillatum]|nr:hypothetical protein DIPPA_26416 [Diplonema papillatum]
MRSVLRVAGTLARGQSRWSSEPSHSDLVKERFGSRADRYVQSDLHAKGEDLQLMADAVASIGDSAAQVLDLGCGGGHASFSVAPLVGQVTAFDLSEEMLASVTDEAARRGLRNVTTKQGSVDGLPFADGSFDCLVSRYSAHHWEHFQKALFEAQRVLKPGGTFVVIDVTSSDDPLLDTWLQTIETIRDPSHVRDHTVAEWHRGLSVAGFEVRLTRVLPLHIDFPSWIVRMQTPEAHAATIRDLLRDAPLRVREHFQVPTDGSSHAFRNVFLVARKC